jgi:hypothetical protein
MQFIQRVIMQMDLIRRDFHCFKYFAHNEYKKASRRLKIIKAEYFKELIKIADTAFLR